MDNEILARTLDGDLNTFMNKLDCMSYIVENYFTKKEIAEFCVVALASDHNIYL
jgi:hypothetical protein